MNKKELFIENNIFSDEFKFLIICCKIKYSENDISFIESYLNSQNIRYDDLIKLALAHRIIPLVYKSLNKLQKEKSITKGKQSIELLFANLKSLYLQIAKQNMLMSAELIRIVKLLKNNNINALVIKGPALSQMAYGDITLRQYGDLDVLVDEKDLFEAAATIASNNYIPDVELHYFKNKALLDVSSDLGLRHAKNHTYIELHWKLFRKKLLVTLDGLNVRSNPTIVKIQGKKIETLQSELLLVYLCSHGSKHMWERIQWIVDIDRLIGSLDGIDWHKVWLYAEETHSINTLLLGLSLCEELFGTNLPVTMKEEIKKRKNISLLKMHTLKSLNGKPTERSTNISYMYKKFNYHLKLYDSFSDKAKYYISYMFKITPDDVLNINLPENLSFLYFIIRPFRLGIKRIRNSNDT